MWYLIGPNGKCLYLKPNKELTFGRKKADVLLQNDESVSRLHATVSVMDKDFVPMFEPTSLCKVKDLNSKYGTYVFHKEEMLNVDANGYNLKHQDKIRFGLQNHLYTVINVPMITVASTLSNDDKNRLEQLMNEMDGMVFYEWIEMCTHLTVTKATLTEKVTCAMACAIPIVTMDYWEQVKRAIDNLEKLPDPQQFVPPIGESLVNKWKLSLSPNEKRKTVFQNLIFIHFSAQQYKIYGKIIKMAGGKRFLYSKKPLTTEELCAENVVVLQYPNSDESQSTQSILPEYNSIYETLQANKRKMIPESEIPLAILHCSVEKYCNPTYRFGKLLKRSAAKCESSEVLVIDTQDISHVPKALPKVISDVPLRTSLNIKIAKPIQIIPETYNDFDSLELQDAEPKQPTKTVKSNVPCTIEKTKDTNRDTLVTEKNVKASDSKKDAVYIPETKDTFSDSSVTEEIVKPLHSKKTAVYIPETKDTFSGTSVIEENTKVSHLKKNTVYIPETNDTFSNTSTMEEIVKVTHTKKSAVCIPETKDTFSGTSVAEKNVNVPYVKKNTVCIPETNDSFSDDSAMEEIVKVSHSKKDIDCAPETEDTISENTQCSVQNTKNVENKKSVKGSTKKIKETKINRKLPLKKTINLNINENSELNETQSSTNINNNYNELFKQNRLDDMFEENNSAREDPEIEMLNLSTEYNFEMINNYDKNDRIPETSNESQQITKRKCKESNKHSSDKKSAVSPKKKTCSKNLNIHNKAASQPTTVNEAEETFNNLTRCNSSFLRVKLNRKCFKKVYSRIPKKRIRLNDMYVWNESNTTNVEMD